MVMLDNIVTMDAMMISYHTPKTKSSQNSGLGRSARPHQGRGACQPEEADAVGVLRQQMPNLHPHHAQECQHQCQLHHQGLGQVLGASEEEEARDGPAGIVFPLG